MEDFFDRFQRITGVSKYSTSEVITPTWVVSDMVDLLPPEVFAPESRFLDPAVKSGRFLAEIYRRLMNSDAMKLAFPNEQDRQRYILDNQLYGFATSSIAATVVRKQLYDDPTKRGNIRFIADKLTVELVKGAFGIMKFDVVVGNPPYNNDIYLDFVTLGHNLASQYTCMITPAKWQAKGGKKNEDFRKNIVPYMSELVYYPDCSDVFEITSWGGISYFLVKQQIQDGCKLRTHCKNKNINADTKMVTFKNVEMMCLLNNGYGILNKVLKIFQRFYKNNRNNQRYVVIIKNTFSGSGSTSWTSGVHLLSPLTYEQLDGHFNLANEADLYYCGTEDECKSVISYFSSRLIRFLMLVSVHGQHIFSSVDDTIFRFVPNPGAFDHIFTDQELYQKYGLTPDEITIIESVIKERK